MQAIAAGSRPGPEVAGLAGAWRRQLLRASAAALIAPVAVAGALLVLAFGGGFAGLGAFSQVFAGPSLGSGSATAAAAPAARLAPALAALVPPASAAPVARSVGTRAVTPSRRHVAVVHHRTPAGSSRPVPAAPVRHQPTGPAPGGQGGGSGGSGGGGGGGSGGGGGGGGGGVTGTVRSVVDSVGSTATSVTKQLPPPVGSTASQAVQTVTTTVDNLLPPSGSTQTAPVTTPLGTLRP